MRWVGETLRFWLLGSALLMAGCTVGPDYVVPEPVMPDAWHQELTKGLAEGEANLQTWWTSLGDPVLDGLIARAVSGNIDLQTAYARVHETRARLGVARGDRYPDLDGIGTYQRTRLSEETNPQLPFGVSRTEDFVQLGFDVSWEIDVFGRVRRSVESADASVQSSVEAYRDFLVILLADVASTYVDVRTLQSRIAFAEGNVGTQSGSLTLTRDRFEAEIAPELDVRQAELNLASTESTIPTLEVGLNAAVHRLGVLIGEHPGTLHEELAASVPIPAPPAEVAVGLPTELLRQRPDIRRAERDLAAQTAQIGVATAELYPRFSLVGTFALEAFEASDVIDQASRAYSVGPAVRWNLFDGGRVRSNIGVQDARAEQAYLQYEQAVLLALEDVENAMVAYTLEMDREAALARSVTAAQRSVELVKTLYRTGLTDFQNVLDSERSLFLQQDALAESRGLVVKSLIDLYRALGGGWAPEPTDDELVEADDPDLEEPLESGRDPDDPDQ